jgi:hypothetical protein
MQTVNFSNKCKNDKNLFGLWQHVVLYIQNRIWIFITINISVKVAHDYDLSQGSAVVYHCAQSKIQVTCNGLGKGKGHPKTGNEGPEKEKRYSSTLFFNLGTRWGWVVNATPWPLYSQEWPSTHSIGGCVGTRDGLERCGKSRPHWDSTP